MGNVLELPVYPPGTQVLDTAGLRALESPDSPVCRDGKVLRGVHINVDLNGSGQSAEDLPFILERTDEELERVARLCGAEVVPHSWGLLHDPARSYPDHRPRRTAAELVPEDHIVVAEVDVIKGALSLGSEYAIRGFGSTIDAVEAGVREYHAEEEGWMLTDMGYPQFVIGTGGTEGASDNTARPVLVDIDPRIEFVD